MADLLVGVRLDGIDGGLRHHWVAVILDPGSPDFGISVCSLAKPLFFVSPEMSNDELRDASLAVREPSIARRCSKFQTRKALAAKGKTDARCWDDAPPRLAMPLSLPGGSDEFDIVPPYN